VTTAATPNDGGKAMAAPVGVRRAGVGDQQPRHEDHEGVLLAVGRVAERELEHERRRRHGGEHGQRVAPPQPEWEEDEQRRDDAGPHRLGEARLDDVGEADRGEHERDDPVRPTPERAPALSDAGGVHALTVTAARAACIIPGPDREPPGIILTV
jgi:hypothetical protein